MELYLHQWNSNGRWNPPVFLCPASILKSRSSRRNGLGSCAVGLQFNHAVSIVVNDKWTNHWNAGFTYIPDGKNPNDEKANLFGFNFGTSAIYDLTEKTNLLCDLLCGSRCKNIFPSNKRYWDRSGHRSSSWRRSFRWHSWARSVRIPFHRIETLVISASLKASSVFAPKTLPFWSSAQLAH